jgi:hypothetical protein
VERREYQLFAAVIIHAMVNRKTSSRKELLHGPARFSFVYLQWLWLVVDEEVAPW